MPRSPSFDSLANQFVDKYLQDYDYKYSIDKPPLNQAFYHEVIEIIKDVYPYILGFSLERIYEFVKTKLSERREKETKNLISQQKILNVFGNGSVLLFGKVRPFFEIPKNSKLYFYNVQFQSRMPSNATPFHLQTNLIVPKGADLVLQNAIIVYEGDLGKFIKEYVAPSVFFIRVVGVAA